MNTTTGTYPHAPGWKANGTSRAAAVAERGRAQTLRDRVLALLQGRDLTADECAEALDESVLAVRPRLSELIKQGRIEPAGIRRRNASGHSAEVWRMKREFKQGALFQ